MMGTDKEATATLAPGMKTHTEKLNLTESKRGKRENMHILMLPEGHSGKVT